MYAISQTKKIVKHVHSNWSTGVHIQCTEYLLIRTNV